MFTMGTYEYAKSGHWLISTVYASPYQSYIIIDKTACICMQSSVCVCV